MSFDHFVQETVKCFSAATDEGISDGILVRTWGFADQQDLAGEFTATKYMILGVTTDGTALTVAPLILVFLPGSGLLFCAEDD